MRDEKGRFVKGHSGYNPELKGCFKKGELRWKILRTDKYKRPCMRIKGKMVLASHYVWCSQPENLAIIPEGCVVHHKDLNPFNNEPSNLVLLPKDYHTSLHNHIRIMNERQEPNKNQEVK